MTNASTGLGDFKLTRDDLEGCGWQAVVQECKEDSYGAISQLFFKGSAKAQSEGQERHSKTLWVLGHFFGMKLDLSDHNNPFKTQAEFELARSVITDHIRHTGTAAFEDLFSTTQNQLVRARVSDFLWMVQTPKNPKFALDAIDSYRAVPLTAESWFKDADTCWRRALTLARLLGRGASEKCSEMELSLLELLRNASAESGLFASKLTAILETYRLAGDQKNDVAERLKQIAKELEDTGNYYFARKYYYDAGLWFRDADDQEKWVEMTVAAAETWVEEATARLSSDNPSNMVATDYYQSAVQVYRTIPREQREPRKLDERMEDILELHREASWRSQDEMTTVEMPAIDLTNELNQVRELVSGKTVEEALRAFTSLYHFKATELREAAVEGLKNTPLRALISTTTYTHDGRVGARTPGFSGQGDSQEEERIEAETISGQYGIHIGFASNMILYGLEILASEHYLQESDFILLSRYSPFIPPEREILFGKALYYGYNRDFGSAIHLLTPQIENIVRVRLQQEGVRTTHTDGNGITTENGLSSLVEHDEFKEAFGEDLAFELEALLCSPHGSNLRNNVAHGLLNDRESYSAHTVYTWWLSLKMVHHTFRAAMNRSQKNAPQEPEDTSPTGDENQVC